VRASRSAARTQPSQPAGTPALRLRAPPIWFAAPLVFREHARTFRAIRFLLGDRKHLRTHRAGGCRSDPDPAGARIPGAVEGVVSSGISAYDLGRFNGSIRYRYLGPRPLIEDNSVRSQASHLVTASLGYAITPRYRVAVEGLNLLNATVSDVDYYYVSRLRGEPAAGVNDTHLHPVEPRAIRIRFEAMFYLNH
jgi:hypothetical protein